ncbi:MAG: AfsR/SARP family transcriptional regulator [Capsulimonadaceae bacterium]
MRVTPVQLRIRMFGELAVDVEGRSFTRFATRMTASMLACLAYFPGRSYTRENLIALLWPDCDLDAGRVRLSTALNSLRRQIEPPGIARGSVLDADRNSIRIVPGSVSTDVADFEDLIARSRTLEGPPRQALLKDAVELYRGQLLPGFDFGEEDWAIGERVRLSDSYYLAITTIRQECEAARDVNQAIDYARRATAAEPYREEAHRELMSLLARAGQPDAALRHYQEHKERLSHEMGEAPEQQTQALATKLRNLIAYTPKTVAPDVSLAADTPPAAARAGQAGGTVTLICLAPGSFPDAAAKRLRRVVKDFGGTVPSLDAPQWLIAFSSVAGAVHCALALRPDLGPTTRTALDTGDVTTRNGVHSGPLVDRLTRLAMAAHPGQVLCGDVTVQLAGDLPEMRLTSLGIYKLSTGTARHHIHQIDPADGPSAAFPPLSLPRATAGRAPVAATRFFGREEEIARLLDMLDDPCTRLVTLIGPGGCGKTRLAMEAAARQMERFSGAVWFVTLADVSDPGLILPSIRSALQLPVRSGLDLHEQVCAALESQPTILFLDNFEQIVAPPDDESDSASGSLVLTDLMDHVRTLKCVVTSRRVLGLGGEREISVRPLPIPRGEDSPDALVRLASVQLFVDRAQSVRPDFQVTPANAAAVAALCAGLEGIPLAIELAAARAHVMSPAQIHERWRDKFLQLQTQKRDVPARHRTLQATIDYSYDLLAEAHRRFFSQLSVFAGGWTAEAAETVCDQPDAIDLLAGLREWSLIIAEDGEADVRLRMLDILREYARERLPEPEHDALVNRHAQYFARLAQGADSISIKADLDNIRTAFQTMTRQTAANGLSIAGMSIAVFPVLHQMGHWDEARRMLAAGWTALGSESTAPFSGNSDRRASAARICFLMASLLSDLGDGVEARRQAEVCLDLVRQGGSTKDGADAVNLLGAICLNLGETEEAERRFREALAMRDACDRSGRGKSLHNLGAIASRRGDAAGARALYEEALKERRLAGDRMGITETLVNIGVLAHNSGDLAGAAMIYQEVLDTYTALDHRWGIAIVLNNLAEIAEANGDLTGAAEGYRKSHVMLRSMGSPHAAASAVSLQRLGQPVPVA